ncbi:MAG: hypothetical protein R6T89_07180 [Candidatus Syntrophosphaera sp.]
MISVKWDNNRLQENIELPQGWVFFCFNEGENPLWCGITPNICQRLRIIGAKAEQESQYAEMSGKADSLQIETKPEAIDALIRYKVYIQKHHPEYQQAIDPSSDYAYLAIDAWRFPFVGIQSHTTEDWTYVGPWRSRFFLTDVMDTLSRILKIPFCETGTFPCEKLEKGICKGYCLNLKEDPQYDDIPDLNKLEDLLKEAYLHPRNGILEMVAQERDNYFNNLEFEKEDLLNTQIELLEKYRDWLNFFYVTKSLSFATEDFDVENGMMSRCRYENEEYLFPVPQTRFRENERLALNLRDLDEARLIYEYYMKNIEG